MTLERNTNKEQARRKSHKNAKSNAFKTVSSFRGKRLGVTHCVSAFNQIQTDSIIQKTP